MDHETLQRCSLRLLVKRTRLMASRVQFAAHMTHGPAITSLAETSLSPQRCVLRRVVSTHVFMFAVVLLVHSITHLQRTGAVFVSLTLNRTQSGLPVHVRTRAQQRSAVVTCWAKLPWLILLVLRGYAKPTELLSTTGTCVSALLAAWLDAKVAAL